MISRDRRRARAPAPDQTSSTTDAILRWRARAVVSPAQAVQRPRADARVGTWRGSPRCVRTASVSGIRVSSSAPSGPLRRYIGLSHVRTGWYQGAPSTGVVIGETACAGQGAGGRCEPASCWAAHRSVPSGSRRVYPPRARRQRVRPRALPIARLRGARAYCASTSGRAAAPPRRSWSWGLVAPQPPALVAAIQARHGIDAPARHRCFGQSAAVRQSSHRRAAVLSATKIDAHRRGDQRRARDDAVADLAARLGLSMRCAGSEGRPRAAAGRVVAGHRGRRAVRSPPTARSCDPAWWIGSSGVAALRRPRSSTCPTSSIARPSRTGSTSRFLSSPALARLDRDVSTPRFPRSLTSRTSGNNAGDFHIENVEGSHKPPGLRWTLDDIRRPGVHRVRSTATRAWRRRAAFAMADV